MNQTKNYRKNRKKIKNKHIKTKKLYGKIRYTGGEGWISYFLPFLGKKEDKKEEDKKEEVNPDVDMVKNPVSPEKKEPESAESKPINNVIHKTDELYKMEIDEQRIEKEYFDDPNISGWCGLDTDYVPVGIIHLSAFVGVDLIRSYATTVQNLVGVQGNLSEKFHRLRNEAFLELKNVMKVKKLDEVCNVITNFWKDSGTIMLNLQATGLRQKKINQNKKNKRFI
jgi:uncharacterized protein YbjQ (UPF0145 family)